MILLKQSKVGSIYFLWTSVSQVVIVNCYTACHSFIYLFVLCKMYNILSYTCTHIVLSAQQQELSLFEHGVGVDFTFSGGGAFNFPHVEKQNSRRVKISLTNYRKTPSNKFDVCSRFTVVDPMILFYFLFCLFHLLLFRDCCLMFGQDLTLPVKRNPSFAFVGLICNGIN